MRAFRVAYDGTDYRGFQRQPDVSTVEDALFDALRALSVLPDDAEKPARYAAAGRTDAGVSALAQTVALEAPEWLRPRALNGELPGSIRAWAWTEVSGDFHATHDATERTYEYHLYAPPRPTRSTPAVDDEAIDDALAALSGTHDCHNLTPDDRNTERTLALTAERNGDYLVITVRAGGFSRELVRRLVSLVRAVGTGEAAREKIDRVLSPEPLPGHEGIAPAPPEPLVLTDVEYPGLAFRIDEDAAESARAVFERRRRERTTGARVAGSIRDGVSE